MLRAFTQFFVIILLSLAGHAFAEEKTDIVYLKNGDRITGEVKNLFRGKLAFDTDHMGVVNIEWDDIKEIVSVTGQTVELTNGQRLFGPLTKPENIDVLVINTGSGPVGVKTDDVYRMYPVESGFWDRLDLSANLGFSWDKGSNVGKYSIGADAVYRRTESLSRVNFTSEITTVDQGEEKKTTSTTRTVLGINHMIFKQDKRFLVYFGNIEENDELGIDLRTLAGAGYGYIPIRSQNSWFSLAAGLDINHELPSEGSAETNLEAAALLNYEYYKYDNPERTLVLNLTIFPSITDFGRWRATFNTNFRIELVEDFFWKLDFYATLDSDPISEDGASSDYGVISSFGYKF